MNKKFIEALIQCIIPHFSFGKCCCCRYLIRNTHVDGDPEYCQKFESPLENLSECPRWGKMSMLNKSISVGVFVFALFAFLALGSGPAAGKILLSGLFLGVMSAIACYNVEKGLHKDQKEKQESKDE